MEFWHSSVIDKSFSTLQELRGKYDFVLIGGWAVFLRTEALKSKDIDIIIQPEELGKIRKDYALNKNERLKKYEIKMDGFDVDIYVAHWSDLGLPAEHVLKNTVKVKGFVIPAVETLLVLKLFAYSQRKGSLKGKKDEIDVVSLLYFSDFNFDNFKNDLNSFDLGHLKGELVQILKGLTELGELKINQKKFADFKRRTLAKL